MSDRARLRFQQDAITAVDGRSAAPTAAGGVFSLRQRTNSIRPPKSTKSLDLERHDSDSIGELDERDVRKRQVRRASSGYTMSSLTLRRFSADGV